MELFYQACEVAATGSEVVMMLYFVSKFLGCRYQGWQNRIFQFLSFFVIFNYMMIVDKIFLPYNAVKDFVVMLLYILYALLLTKGARLYQIILPAAGIIMIAGINIFADAGGFEPSSFEESKIPEKRVFLDFYCLFCFRSHDDLYVSISV